MRARQCLRLAQSIVTVPSRLARDQRRLRKLGLSGLRGLPFTLLAHERKLLAQINFDLLPAEFLRDADTVIDVGANRGLWSEAALRVLRPRRLLALEPSADSYAVLAERLRGRVGTVALNLALGDYEGRAPLYRFSRPELNSLHTPVPELESMYGLDSEPPETVEVGSLDRVLQDLGMLGTRISLLKLDVQGGEMGVLKGATVALQTTHCVVLEVLFTPHYQRSASFCDLHMFMTKKAGFTFHNFGALASDCRGRLMWADALYVESAALTSLEAGTAEHSQRSPWD